jgi:hypothetical protein
MPKRQSAMRIAVVRLAATAALVSALLLLAQGCLPFPGRGLLRPGTSAPAFGVEFLDESLTLDQLSGRVVVVNFWSST